MAAAGFSRVRQLRERGIAFVEFVIAIVPLILVAVAIFDVTRYLLIQHLLTRSAEMAVYHLKAPGWD